MCSDCLIFLYPPDASGLAFAMPPPHIQRFLALTLSVENYTSYLHQICRISSLGGKLLCLLASFWKNKLVRMGISLKSIYLFELAVLVTRRLNLFIGDVYNRYIQCMSSTSTQIFDLEALH